MSDRKTEILKSNLAWLQHDIQNTDVLYRACLEKLADLAADMTPGEAKGIYDSICETNVRGFALFCSLIVSKSKAHHEQVADISSPRSVSYLRSHMTDKAFNIFSNNLGSLSAVYGPDFKSICEDVYYERTDACILPLESSSDGLLMSFRQLLLKYELNIFAVCDVIQNDDSTLTLALLTAHPSNHGELCEVYFPSVPTGALEDICAIISTLGGKIQRVSSICSEYAFEADHHICIDMQNTCLDALKFCFDALYPSHMILGNYSNLNKGKE